MASSQKRSLSRLTALTYHPNDHISDEAVRDFGCISQEIARSDPEYVRGHLRRLFWLVSNESGGFCPRAPEMIGAVIANSPEVFDEFISPLVYLLDMEPEDAQGFRPGILRAILRIAARRPGSVAFSHPLVEPLLVDVDPAVRRLARKLMEIIGT